MWRRSCRLPLCPKLPCNHCSCLALEPNGHLAPPAAYRCHLAAGTSQRDPEPVPPPSSHTPRTPLQRSPRLFTSTRGAWQSQLRAQMLGGRCSGRPAASDWPAGGLTAARRGPGRAPNGPQTTSTRQWQGRRGCGSGTCVEPAWVPRSAPAATRQGMPGRACVLLLPSTLPPSPFAQSHRITHCGCCLAVLLVKVKLERMRAV